jgi:hypothetical protein
MRVVDALCAQIRFGKSRQANADGEEGSINRRKGRRRHHVVIWPCRQWMTPGLDARNCQVGVVVVVVCARGKACHPGLEVGCPGLRVGAMVATALPTTGVRSLSHLTRLRYDGQTVVHSTGILGGQ